MKYYSSQQGFSILLSIFLIGFLLVLTVGVFHLVLREMIDNRGAEDYLKSYAGAEGAMEIGLLKVKENGYGYDEDIAFTDSGSEVLSFNASFNGAKDPDISYSMDIKALSYSGTLASGETVIIPLFWKNDSVDGFADNLSLQISSGADADMAWNIIGKDEGMSATGSFVSSTILEYKKSTGGFESSKTVQNFLSNNHGSYLSLLNIGSGDITYMLQDSNSSGGFSKPIGTLTSHVKVGKFQQNISTDIDNTKFLQMLKYALYSK